MHIHFLRKPTFWIIASILLAVIGITLSSPLLMATPAQIQNTSLTKNSSGTQLLTPTADEVRTSIKIADQLNYNHYQELAIDDQLSFAIFNSYLDMLDHSKSYLLESDIESFKKYRTLFDDALKSGNLTPSFDIFNRYQQRFIEQLKFSLFLINNEMEKWQFTQNESFDPERKKAQWAKTPNELNDLTRKRIKAAALNLILANKSLKEAKQILLRRYEAKLNRSMQINSEDVFQTYMNALTKIYDPHTQYLSPQNSENFNINISLSLEGIGAVLQNEDEYTKVVSLVPAGPAEKSGLLNPADRIVGVGQSNGEIVDIVGWRIDEVVELIRGEKGSVVRLEIIPSMAKNTQETKIIKITRDTVKLEEQAAQKKVISFIQNGKPYKIGVITIPAFYIDYKAMSERDPNYRSTTRDVTRLLQALSKESINGLVLDLRDNGGGYLQEANQLVGLFIKTGPTVQVRDNRGRIEVLRDDNPAIIYNGPLVVLTNRLSASASEIFAGAIQDYHRGLIIGSRTFGKGTVQALINLDRGQIKITESKFYRISGESNQHLGIVPDINLPNLYDETQIGESALENALPWDHIKPVPYRLFSNTQPSTTRLIALHKRRVERDPDFNYLLGILALNKINDLHTDVLLNKKQRLEERQRNDSKLLTLENIRRTAKGLAPLKKITSDINADEEFSSSKNKDKMDPLLTETAHIMADILTP